MLAITESSCAEMMVNILINNVRKSIFFIVFYFVKCKLSRSFAPTLSFLNATHNLFSCNNLANR